ncbi:MAG: DMT family transporter [Acidimicrobiales bacterium]|jgi:drug/metabolite transporter (DMT)-like permease
MGRGLVSVVVLALASAASYGLAAVLQHHVTTGEPDHTPGPGGLLLRVIRRPMWIIGSALDGVGYLFQFLALRRGSLALVEPLLVLSLVFALPVAARLDHRRITAREVGSTGVIAVGLALFLAVARPGLGHPHASTRAWLVLSGVMVVLCGAAALGARGASPRRAAFLLAAGSGAAFGYVAALTERTGHLLDRGIGHTLASWVPYALIVGGTAALLFTQSAFHAGALRLSLPTLTVVQPLVAVAIGIAFFGEHVDSRTAAPVFEVIGLALVTLGVFALGSSSVIVEGLGPP